MADHEWQDGLIEAYLDYGRKRRGGTKESTKEERWAYDAVCKITDSDDPEEVLPFVIALLKVTPDDQLNWVAAGPLEDLLREHGAAVIDRVLKHAERCPQIRLALDGVWGIEDMDPSVGTKLDEARGRWKA